MCVRMCAHVHVCTTMPLVRSLDISADTADTADIADIADIAECTDAACYA